MDSMEANLAPLHQLQNDATNADSTTSKLGGQVRHLESQQDSLEDHPRGSIVIFYGIQDTDGESYMEKFGASLEPTEIERAHKLGVFRDQKIVPQ